VDVLAEQRRYYAARAPEYDDWWHRRGRYDLGEEGNARWAADVAEVERALDALRPFGDVLELAAGTGTWTGRLAAGARRVVAVDASEEVLSVNRRRSPASVEYVVADLFGWEPRDRFDLCCFGFWLSHVPEERFDAFWAVVRRALRRGGRVFLVDSAAGDSSHAWSGDGEVEVRRLADGREFHAVKRRWRPEELARRVAQLGWELELACSSAGHFVYGTGTMSR